MYEISCYCVIGDIWDSMCSISYGDKSSKLMDRINMKKYNMDFGDNNGLQKTISI